MERLLIAIGLVWYEGKLLIAQRRPGAHQELKWEFPGGKVRAQETAEAAVVREVLEETGLDVRVESERAPIHHAYPERRVELRVFDCRTDSPNAEALASVAVRWVKPRDLVAYAFPSANAELIAELASAQAR